MAKYIDMEAALLEIERRERLMVGDKTIHVDALKRFLLNRPAADVTPVVHGRCPICSGRKILTQDCDNGYSVEVDAEQGEMSIWEGATCLTVISIDYCPNCGAKMDGGGSDEAD